MDGRFKPTYFWGAPTLEVTLAWGCINHRFDHPLGPGFPAEPPTFYAGKSPPKNKWDKDLAPIEDDREHKPKWRQINKSTSLLKTRRNCQRKPQ
jgi:hypothetical protein